MKVLARCVAALAAILAASAQAGEGEHGEHAIVPPAAPPWEFAVTAYPTAVRGGDNYTSVIAAADRGPLHFEARYSYESIDARSAFVGWTFSGGETLAWEFRPIVGGAWGTTQAFIPGFEASVAWGPLDVYVEAEYVRDSHDASARYTYAWSELGLRPVEWLRIGVAGQRTKAYGGDREFQRGPFAQITVDRLTIGGYWFNPGSDEQIFVGMIGVTF
jgi:hypothetical protein